MLDLEITKEHHPVLEKVVDLICQRTQQTDRKYFRTLVAYYFAKMASSMRATISTHDRGEIPVNLYVINLATSGFGKGHSVNILEGALFAGFERRFMKDTFPTLADAHLWKLGIERAVYTGKSEEDEKSAYEKMFNREGPLLYSFDNASSPAIKALRNKVLLAGAGALNLQIDEIGSNLSNSLEALVAYLELFDQGFMKQKLTKNTSDNIRVEELDGKSPANALLFGTPDRLFDGSDSEKAFVSLLETGYARRCLYAWGEPAPIDFDAIDPVAVYNAQKSALTAQTSSSLSTHFSMLADPARYGWEIRVDDAVGIAFTTYRLTCQKEARQLPSHENIRRVELEHRYFKALKLAGAFAFVDESNQITMDHFRYAVTLVEESGEAFDKLLNREEPYVKLAKYIAATKNEVTHADLYEKLPFYKSGNAARTDMMNMARSWGYKNHIVIKQRFDDGIEFFQGETLQETNLEQMMVAYSDHFAYNYAPEKAPFDKLHLLTQAKDMHWSNHWFEDQHRMEEKAIPGFNMVVIDVDGGIAIETVHDLLKDYRFMTYTTKRHTPTDHRFRLLMPINYLLHLDQADYKGFMNSLMQWLPFETDPAANQRSKKWMSCPTGTYHYNLEGDNLDALQFLPRTSRNEQYQKKIQELNSLGNLERWFAQRIGSGNRNNQLIKYALALVDSRMGFNEVQDALFAFNSKLGDPLTEDEIRSSILVTVSKRFAQIA